MLKTLKSLKNNNQGLSLIEFIVVCGILAVILGVSSFSLGLTPATEAKKVIYNVDAMISRTKVGSLAKEGDVYMEIYINDKEQVVLNYYENDILRETEVLTSRTVTVKYETRDGESDTLEAKESLVLSFDRRTTGFDTLDVSAGLTAGSTGTHHTTVVSHSGDYCKKIIVSGNTVTYEIVLGPVTGSHEKNI